MKNFWWRAVGLTVGMTVAVAFTASSAQAAEKLFSPLDEGLAAKARVSISARVSS
jgi:hypothetical protein